MISVIHPSKGRPEQAIDTANNWIAKADNEVEYVISIDKSDPLSNKYLHVIQWESQNIMYHEWDNKSAIEAINNAAKHTDGDIIIVVSDDFDCPEHWDTLLLEAIGGKQDFCAKTSDGHQDWLITLPIMDRKYYELFGYVYNPDYSHMFADLEMTCVAWMLGRYIELPLTFKHNHYSLTGQKPDAINRKNNATWGQGQMLFKRRMAKNFGIDPVQGLPDLKQHFV